ncbi:SIMPL domain-containing protein [Paracoccus gahaiensis]|uniref:SIMPL domain-containing protein n=1 Tax=Paracoccus gahaiensis TaxID=1706839 RepID=A0A4U0RF33_9RHOB|nr:SIMPL domain-containing protein [Paracoccus gahaiensis]TJZ94083.1 SIMPL domain-containing protein [Paracoccus gahaiensis]
MRPSLRAPHARRLALSVALAALTAGPALAAPMACGPAGPSRMTVTGEGQSRTAPDMASIQLGVTTQADSAAEAMSQNNDRQSAVIAALTDTGIDAAQIQTSGLSLNPLMQYGENQAPTVTGYQASNMVTVRVSDLGTLGEVLDAIVGAGANEINGITFTREDGASTQDDARREAVADARRKAEVLAEAAGVELGPLMTLRDVATGNGGPRPMMRMEAAMADSTPVQPGEVETTAQVEVEFALAGEGACAPMPSHGRHHGGPQGGPAPAPVDPPMPGDGAPAADEPIVPGIVEPLPEAPAN